jgi:NTE family protein
MNTADFTNHEDIQEGIESLRGLKVSDIIDKDGNQYVDLVQEGGGVLGIALVGYTYVLEKLNIRFFSLAGTSAGAINTMMIAGLGRLNEAKSEKILEILSNKNLFDLVDGDKAVKKLIQKAIKKEKGIGLSLVWNAIKIYRILKTRLGINPGDDCEKWITGELSKAGIKTLADLNELRNTLPKGLKNTADGDTNELWPKLAIITSDVTTHTKVDFPRMAGLYWENPDAVSPVDFVRASMSIPFFFTPFEVNDLPNAGNTKDDKWNEYAGYSGEIPKKVMFVDGGLLSNFPINVFHRKDGGVPRMPTFGVRLSAHREKFSTINSLFRFGGAMIGTMRQIYDYDFLLQNADYKELICRIDADQEFNWLDFNMSRKEQIKLFRCGASKAIEFLNKFDWEEYKKIRRQIQNSRKKPDTGSL